MLAGFTEERTGKTKGLQHIVIFALLTVLPGIQSSLFGLTYFFIPLAVLFYIYKWEHGKRFVVAGLVIAAVISLMAGSFGTFLFTATFIPAGYVLAASGFRNFSPARSGLRATISLVGCWFLLLSGFTVVTGVNPVTDFLASLDTGVEEALRYYRQSESASVETIELIEQSFYQIQTILPKVLPSLILGFALLTVWFSMISGNHLIQRFTGYRPWHNHRHWVLPDKLIWLLIISAVLSMLPIGYPRLIGVNALIICSFIYFFQGFSIFTFFMEKWNIPLLLRAFFYGMMLFQSFGTIILLVIGIGDVWFDLRRLKPKTDEHDQENNQS